MDLHSFTASIGLAGWCGSLLAGCEVAFIATTGRYFSLVSMRCLLHHTQQFLINMNTNKRVFSKAGFTLVESIIVIVIVVLLAALAYPALEKVREKYCERSIMENLEKVAAAGCQYIEEKGVQSVDLETLTTAGYLESISPVAGEHYSEIRIIEEGGVISVFDENSNEVSFSY